ncbi:MAG: DUF4465 domain-containing protein [Marinilabiliaceae bacterium]
MQKILDVIRIMTLICFTALLSFFWHGCADGEKEIPPPEIFLPQGDEEIEVNQGDTIQLEPKITYNYNPTYEWRKNGEMLDHQSQFLTDTASQLGRIEYFFGVTTPHGSDSMIIPVDVIILADFQNMDIPEETDTAWIGSEETEGFEHKILFFPNHFQENDSSWQGFGYSNSQSTTTSTPVPPHSVYHTSAGESDNIFGLVRQIENNDEVPAISFTDGKEHRLKSIDMANTTLGHYRMKFGDDHFERLGGPTSDDPDWVRVTIKGIDKDGGNTGEIKFYLGDYRFDNNKRDYIVNKWTEVPLNELGLVHKIEFHLTSNKTNDEGEMVTPRMFCIDNLKIQE